MAFKTNNVSGAAGTITQAQTQSAPAFARAPQSQAMTAASGADLFAYAAGGEEIKLTLADIRDYFCPNASEKECMLFGQLCKANALNPWLHEAYLIKYDKSAPAAMVVGKDAYVKRASEHPAFDGFEAGVKVYDPESGNIEYREGAAYYPAMGEQLIGGWARVYRKDRSRPAYEEVALEEYNTNQSKWKSSPATMIRKVAMVHALREAFPGTIQGMYDEDEIQVPADYEGTAQEVASAQLAAARQQPKPRRAVKAPEPAPEADPLADIEEAPDGDLA